MPEGPSSTNPMTPAELGEIRDKFLSHLLKDLEAINKPERAKQRRPKPTPNIVRSLAFREMGGVPNLRAPGDHFYTALLKSKARSFDQRNYEINPKGRFSFEEFWVFNYRSKQLINVKTGEGFSLEEAMLPFEKVAGCAFVHPSFPVEAPDSPPHLLVLLTDIHIYVYDIVKRAIVKTFVFPAEYKFSKIVWNKDQEELCATGWSRNIGNSVSYEKRPCLAVFTLTPFCCKYAFVMNPQIFPKINEAVVVDDVLMCFCQSPHRFIAYNMQKLYQDTCVELEMPVVAAERTTIVWNLHIVKEPPRILEMKGAYSNVFFGLDTIIQFDPQGRGERYRLRNFRDIRTQPTLLEGVSLPWESDPTSFLLDEPQMSGFGDSTPRMLRIKDNYVECYEAERVIGGERTVVRVGWRTALIPPQPMSASALKTTRSGRVVRSVVAMTEEEYTVKLTYLGHHSEFVVVLVAYDVNTFHYPVVTATPQNPCWVNVAFFLDDTSGDVVRVEPLKMDLSNLGMNDFRQSAALLDDCLIVRTENTSKTTLQVLEMIEVEAEEWEKKEDEEMDIEQHQKKFTPSTMSRKQRRLARRAERQRYSPI